MSNDENQQLRREFLKEVRWRLIGPGTIDESMREKPNKRYLTGMIFPKGASSGRATADEQEFAEDLADGDEQEELESPMDMVFQKLPASVGLTFAIAEAEERIVVQVAGARYERSSAELVAAPAADAGGAGPGRGRSPQVWQRRPLVESDAELAVTFDVRQEGRQSTEVFGGRASVHLFIRRAQGVRIATVSLVNERKTAEDAPVEVTDILFQVRMKCRPDLGVPSYPDPPTISEDEEAEELALQYRSMPTFAVGHGCGVAWSDPVLGQVEDVAVDFMPTVEVPPVTTDIDSLPVSVQRALSIFRLQDAAFDPAPAFAAFIDAYVQWRDRLASVTLPARFDPPRARVLDRIDAAVERMKDGARLLATEPAALDIFRLANRAMLLSVARASANRGRAEGTTWRDVDLQALPPNDFRWRPFQLAFFLLSLRGLWQPNHRDRAIVDLIWFPTGGGKTEAYLAVAAFEMLRRRFVEGKRGGGTAVIKRYTLRLLTIQQFERAGGLICALETLRRAGHLPGHAPFCLGLWVGKDSSPNEHKSALADLDKIQSTIGKVEGVKVPLKQCPVCATPIVPARKNEGMAGVGMRAVSGSLELFCPDAHCAFHGGLPISYVDEQLYRHPPTMLLGTIDKFAMLAWRDEARAFFGTGLDVVPPSLIIQDELHLISGPLGTLAGIYEAAIDTAISSLGRGAKYICATATIRRADDQIRKLYGRQAALFPPPGLDAADSFFSRAQKQVAGRLYVGAMGQGHTPTFSNVIASTALLAAGGVMRKKIGDLTDTWWTLVAYHNSKRELGKTLSLARDDIPARLHALGEPRSMSGAGVKELSANLRDSEIPEALHQLATGLPDKATLDFVACTNMLSVGVDVQRLGLMLVNGQPKTVSEYIQASSRVGRDARRPPGIVFALFSPTKPRDRSHYEFFGAFHKGYYRHVEPTSVTPFAPPAQDRGLHGAFLVLVRMVSSLHANTHASKIDRQSDEVSRLADAFLARIAAAEDGDIAESREHLDRFIREWTDLARAKGANLRFQSGGRQHAQLIKPYREQGEGRETLQSLRHVDTPLKLFVPMVQTGVPA
ncbi:helicase-related protein [Xenophilus aerolatus]|nr:helicase-related protein [Xenophilus aerolatus]